MAAAVGCAELSIDLARRKCRIDQHDFTEGDWLTLDGDQGAVYVGRLEVVIERPEAALANIARWHAVKSGGAPALV